MGRDELKRFFYNDFVSLVRNVISDTEKQTGIFVSDDFKAFICDFFTEAIAGMLVNGFKEKNKIRKNNVIRNITVILHSLPDILKRRRRNNMYKNLSRSEYITSLRLRFLYTNALVFIYSSR